MSAFFVSNGFLTNLSDYSIAYLFLFVKKRKEEAAFLPDLLGRGILPPIDEYNRTISVDVITHTINFTNFPGKDKSRELDTVITYIVNDFETDAESLTPGIGNKAAIARGLPDSEKKLTDQGIVDVPLKYQIQCTAQKVHDMIICTAFDHPVNPIRDRITESQWDGTDRLQQIYDMYQIPIEDELSRVLIKKWLMQAVCGLFNDDNNNPFDLPYTLVFSGAQGAGKSKFFKHLAMIDKYFGDGKTLDPHNVDSIMQATSTWICELGEIDSTFKKDISALKGFLTQAADVYRVPYGHAAGSYNRRTTFCGTVNDEQFLIDETGNRRFLTIVLGDNVKLDYDTQIKTFDSLQLWAQIYDIIRQYLSNGYRLDNCFRLTTAEESALEQRNGQHVKQSGVEKRVCDIMAQAAKYHYTWEWMTVSEFMDYHRFKDISKTSYISKILKKLGYSDSKQGTNQNGVYSKLRYLPTFQSTPKHNFVIHELRRLLSKFACNGH